MSATPLPDSEAWIDGRRYRLTERELISYPAPVGKDGAWITVSYVTARAVPA